ncbi:MAG: methyltransferase domain-containing protein [Pseudomonadota bacterium]
MAKSIKKAVKKSRLVRAVKKRLEDKRNHRHAVAEWKAIESRAGVCLEIGSGVKRGQGNWVTVDQNGADITWDLRDGFPLRDGCIDKIYCSHLLEHIPYEQLVQLVSECRRVLRNGGEFSVCVPNARNYITAYMKEVTFRDRETLWEPAVIDTGSNIDQLNYIAYMGGEHKYMFDPENLINTLLKGGFSNVVKREFDPSLDMRERDHESIYASAFK